MKVHRVVSESGKRSSLQGFCFRCHSPVREGITAEIVVRAEENETIPLALGVVQKRGPTYFTRHVPLHISCSPPRIGEEVEVSHGFLVAKKIGGGFLI